MNLEQLSPIIEKAFKDALEAPIYKFGMPTKKGLSNKIASGGLKDSIKAIPSENEISIEMNSYAKFVQSGRQPGKKGVPIDALLVWIKERHITGKNKQGKKLSDRSMAFAIQKSIKKFGIATQPSWYDIAIQSLYDSKELEDALGDLTVDDLLNNIEGI
jgi:hypothetical protein